MSGWTWFWFVNVGVSSEAKGKTKFKILPMLVYHDFLREVNECRATFTNAIY
jgi:hypothetical protein